MKYNAMEDRIGQIKHDNFTYVLQIKTSTMWTKQHAGLPTQSDHRANGSGCRYILTQNFTAEYFFKLINFKQKSLINLLAFILVDDASLEEIICFYSKLPVTKIF